MLIFSPKGGAPAVLLTGDQTVAGIKTFTDAMFFSTAAGSSPSMRMTDDDVAHGITLFGRTTNTIFDVSAYSSTGGGILAWGMNALASIPALAFWGVSGSTVPTVAPVLFSAGKKNGATVQAVGATEKAISFVNSTAGGVIGALLLDIYGNGNAFFPADVSALTFTDRTPGYDGDALAELTGVRAKDGKIDHATLPKFARAEIHGTRTEEVDGVAIVTKTVEEGRDLGAMISLLTVAVQQLAAKVEALEEKSK